MTINNDEYAVAIEPQAGIEPHLPTSHGTFGEYWPASPVSQDAVGELAYRWLVCAIVALFVIAIILFLLLCYS